MTGLIGLLITILVVGIIVGILWWVIDLMPIIPAQFKQVAKLILLLIALLVILARALPMLGVQVM